MMWTIRLVLYLRLRWMCGVYILNDSSIYKEKTEQYIRRKQRERESELDLIYVTKWSQSKILAIHSNCRIHSWLYAFEAFQTRISVHKTPFCFKLTSLHSKTQGNACSVTGHNGYVRASTNRKTTEYQSRGRQWQLAFFLHGSMKSSYLTL